MKRSVLRRAIIKLNREKKLKWLSDKAQVKLMYWTFIGKRLNLDDPKTYTEKLQWLKLYDRKPLYTKMVDKFEAKGHIADIVGEQYIIPTFGVWDKFEDINFDSLPDQFVLKCTHDSGGLVICRDKSKLDIEFVKNKINKSLGNDYYLHGREWPYKDVKPRIIAEKYMIGKDGSDPKQFKWFCFNGKAKVLLVESDKFLNDKQVKTDFYDREYNHLPFTTAYPNSDLQVEKTDNLEKMAELAEQLSAGIPHLRVDFFDIDGDIYLGELTFFTGGGVEAVRPAEWDLWLGDLLVLPPKPTNIK